MLTPEHRETIEKIKSKLPRQDSQHFMPGLVTLNVIFDLDPWLQGFYFCGPSKLTPILVDQPPWAPSYLAPGIEVNTDMLANLQVYLAKAYSMNFSIEDIKTCIRYMCSHRVIYDPEDTDFDTFVNKHERKLVKNNIVKEL